MHAGADLRGSEKVTQPPSTDKFHYIYKFKSKI